MDKDRRGKGGGGGYSGQRQGSVREGRCIWIKTRGGSHHHVVLRQLLRGIHHFSFLQRHPRLLFVLVILVLVIIVLVIITSFLTTPQSLLFIFIIFIVVIITGFLDHFTIAIAFVIVVVLAFDSPQLCEVKSVFHIMNNLLGRYARGYSWVSYRRVCRDNERFNWSRSECAVRFN